MCIKSEKSTNAVSVSEVYYSKSIFHLAIIKKKLLLYKLAADTLYCTERISFLWYYFAAFLSPWHSKQCIWEEIYLDLVFIYGLFDTASSSYYVIWNDRMITNGKHIKESRCWLTGRTTLAAFKRYWGKSQKFCHDSWFPFRGTNSILLNVKKDCSPQDHDFLQLKFRFS